METLRKNPTRLMILAILALLFLMAIQGMSAKDWVITLLRGLSVSAITFLVASGFSLIFGLLDVLNLAHGTLFMIGAYVGWTVYVRPDTFVDLLAPLVLLTAGLLLRPFWDALPGLGRWNLPPRAARVLPWLGLALALALVAFTLSGWPLSKWDPGVPAQAPMSPSQLMDQAVSQGQPRVAPDPSASGSPLGLLGMLLGGALLAASLTGFARRRGGARADARLPGKILLAALALALVGVGVYLANDWLTERLFGLHTTWIALLAVLVAMCSGAVLGGLMEVTLIRPLYERPIYQLMITMGLGVSGIEVVRSIWGRVAFTMPKPQVFRGTGEGCPATTLGGWLEHQCSTFSVLGGRVRVYNEVFVILVGLLVLVVVWVLLQRSRLGMIIRAGVQDSDMVEALGINVRLVFTLVFALGAALAALGGVIAAPSMGLSPLMGESMLLLALIAMAIGGLTSFPGAAVGSLLVGLLQQFIIKYGQIGIKLPFMDQPFKPTPPLVPASTVLLMVIILLVMPQGLFGRKE
ncbi:MAG: branched-chain amino acid ABC transporter permease [Delftia sp.]|nr:branched-chain amino acid ABC transporter permease [Delftia sp.]